MSRTLKLAVVAPLAILAQTVDLSVNWRLSAHDGPSNASSATDDRQWSTTTLPLHNQRPPEGLWLRRTIVVPDGATTLVLGRLPLHQLYPNEIEQPTSGAPGPARVSDAQRQLSAHDRHSPRRQAHSRAESDPRRRRPYLLTTDDGAYEAIQQARSYLQRQLSSPYVLLAGCQLTLVIALLLIWFLTGRQYSTLFWVAAYILYSSHNLLRFSLLPQLPASPRFLPAILSLQLGLAISGLDSRRNTLALWGSYVVLLLTSGNVLSGKSSSVATGYANAWTSAPGELGVPAWAESEPLSLTLGAIEGVYEVYVNGWRIGGNGAFDSFENAQTGRPRTFELPRFGRSGSSSMAAQPGSSWSGIPLLRDQR